MRKGLNSIGRFILIIFCIIVFLKMCQITYENKDMREPLREIDNWR